MKKIFQEKEEDLVEEFRIGNAQIKIYDTYCKNKTPEEVHQILERCSWIASASAAKDRPM